MKTIDLFSGVGGLSLGFKLNEVETSIAIEYSKEIANGFAHNFPDAQVIASDINDVNFNEIFDGLDSQNFIIIGGPPCQGFSQKGSRKGLSDPRNFLFRKYIEAVKVLMPAAFLIENVPGIITSSEGFFLNEIESELIKLGYTVQHSVLDAKDYGVPQSRKRAFIVGILNGYGRFSWPKKNSFTTTVGDAISDLPKLESGEGLNQFNYSSEPQSKYQEEMRLGSSAIYNHIATRHSPIVLERLSLIPENGGRDDLPEEHLTKSIFSGTWCRLSKDTVARTITTRFDTPSSGMFTLPDQNRCLTVREAARLQSFPDTFHFIGNKSTQMKQVGNAVPPLLSKAIASEILKALKLKP